MKKLLRHAGLDAELVHVQVLSRRKVAEVERDAHHLGTVAHVGQAAGLVEVPASGRCRLRDPGSTGNQRRVDVRVVDHLHEPRVGLRGLVRHLDLHDVTVLETDSGRIHDVLELLHVLDTAGARQAHVAVSVVRLRTGAVADLHRNRSGLEAPGLADVRPVLEGLGILEVPVLEEIDHDLVGVGAPVGRAGGVVGAVAVLVDAVVTDVGGAGVDRGLAVVAVLAVDARASDRVARDEAVGVHVGLGAGHAAVAVGVQAVADLISARVDGGIGVVAVHVVREPVTVVIDGSRRGIVVVRHHVVIVHQRGVVVIGHGAVVVVRDRCGIVVVDGEVVVVGGEIVVIGDHVVVVRDHHVIIIDDVAVGVAEAAGVVAVGHAVVVVVDAVVALAVLVPLVGVGGLDHVIVIHDIIVVDHHHVVVDHHHVIVVGREAGVVIVRGDIVIVLRKIDGVVVVEHVIVVGREAGVVIVHGVVVVGHVIVVVRQNSIGNIVVVREHEAPGHGEAKQKVEEKGEQNLAGAHGASIHPRMKRSPLAGIG